MRLFLSSKGLANEEIVEHFLSFVENNKKVSIITTASEKYKEKNKHAIDLKIKLDHLGFRVGFVDVELENPQKMNASDIIVINGGNPYYLLYHFKKNKADKILQKIATRNHPIMGISAGFMILMQDLKIIDLLTPEMNTINLKDKKGMNLVDEIIIPHYDRFVNEGIIKKEIIDRFQKQSTKEVIRLGEFQCLKYENNTKEIIGELLDLKMDG